MNSKYLLVALAMLDLVNTGFSAGPIASTSNKPACCVKELAAASPLPDRSLYQLDSSWTDDAGAAVKLVSFRGRPQIVTMFFARCEYACPLLVHDMKRIEAALPENVRTNVGFVLVSFDSERDTPAALAAYRKNHNLASNWTLLRGAPDDVLELAALLDESQKRNFEKWPILGRPINPNYFVGASYEQEIGFMKKFIGERLDWIEKQFPPVPQMDVADRSKIAFGGVSAGDIYLTLDGTDPRAPGGEVAPTAQRFTAVISRPPAAKVFARVKQDGRWSGPLLSFP